MIYLDTHIVGLLKSGYTKLLTPHARRLIDRDPDIRISPMVVLELALLYEINRFLVKPSTVLKDLGGEIGLTVCDQPFGLIAEQAVSETWTRDPFDRMIVAQAKVSNAKLVTRDLAILKHYPQAVE